MFKFILLMALQISNTVLANSDLELGCNYNGTQQQMNFCAQQDYKVADKTLNRNYQSLLKSINFNQQKVLKSNQKKWLKERNTFCKVRTAEFIGGSVFPLEWYSCLKSFTDSRNEKLQVWLETKEIN